MRVTPMPKEAQLPTLNKNQRLAAQKASRQRHDGRRLLSTSEAAEYLGVGQTTVYALIRSGKLRSFKVQGLLRLRPSDLDDYVDGNVSS
jgi:excisionase family DNA binding protein